jgi:Dolichyl-phosphate-mannose-protein mannosyltransferase
MPAAKEEEAGSAPRPQPGVVSSSISPGHSALARWYTAANTWTDTHLDWVMWLVTVGGLYVRIQHASGTYLNADETQIMFPPLQDGLAAVYSGGLVFPYGPLANFLLHFMTFFGSSELYFRMPSILAGALLAFVGYKWVSETFGKSAGLITGCLLAFAPPLVNLSAQVRHYSIHALFIACSLYCLERAVREQSRKWMRYFGVSIFLAILTMYMSIWYLMAIGTYAGLRMAHKELSGALVRQWIKIHVAAAGLLIAAYTTHLYKLRGSEGERLARDGWLRPSYFHPESQTLIDFLWHATEYLFAYVFANKTLGAILIIVFLAGIGLILLNKTGVPGNRRMALLSLVMPLVVTATAGALGIYPYGGSRHDAFLAIFVIAGVAVTLAAALRNRVLVTLLVTLCLVPTWLQSAEPHYLDDLPAVSKVDQMRHALAFLSSRIPRPAVLLVDEIGATTLNYYLCHGRTKDWQTVAPEIVTYRCGRYRLLATDTWTAPPSTFARTLAAAQAAMPHTFVDPVWVFTESLVLTKDETRSDEFKGVFGKIEMYQVSP